MINLKKEFSDARNDQFLNELFEGEEHAIGYISSFYKTTHKDFIAHREFRAFAEYVDTLKRDDVGMNVIISSQHIVFGNNVEHFVYNYLGSEDIHIYVVHGSRAAKNEVVDALKPYGQVFRRQWTNSNVTLIELFKRYRFDNVKYKCFLYEYHIANRTGFIFTNNKMNIDYWRRHFPDVIEVYDASFYDYNGINVSEELGIKYRLIVTPSKKYVAIKKYKNKPFKVYEYER